MNLPDPAKVIGQTIVEVRVRFGMQAIDGWLDGSRTYFRLSNGYWITTSGLELASSPPSEDFQSVVEPWCGRIIGRAIRDLLSTYEDGQPDDSWVMLHLSDGTRVWETSVAPHGTGLAGIYVVSEGEFRTDCPAEVRSIWSA